MRMNTMGQKMVFLLDICRCFNAKIMGQPWGSLAEWGFWVGLINEGKY